MEEAEPGLAPGSASNFSKKFRAEFDLRAFFLNQSAFRAFIAVR
jgi:hypothetical protein